VGYFICHQKLFIQQLGGPGAEAEHFQQGSKSGQVPSADLSKVLEQSGGKKQSEDSYEPREQEA
jgi:hypothetical protein